jgi:peptidoglycan/xylan/chitin deacetylase (PgdA/CDA1 family)
VHAMEDRRSNRVPILLYHGIREHREDGFFDPYYALPLRSLESQIGWLSKNGYSTVALEVLLSAQSVPENAFVITVDDGLKSAYTHIFPVLSHAGYRAIFFPVTGGIGRNGWMSWRDLEEMRKAGMEIGSHSVTHRNLAEAGRKELVDELAGSKKLLEDKLGAPVRFLSLPGGYTRHLVQEVAGELGYEAICSSVFGYNRLPVERYRLRRFCLRRNDGEAAVRMIMRREIIPLLPRFVRERGKDICTAILGRRIYSRLRKRLIPKNASSTLPRVPR